MNENKLMPRRSSPPLRFSPSAWGKLIYLRDLGSTEVGGFAITAADDLLYVVDVRMVRQRCTSVTVKFDDQAVADYFDQQIDAGLRPEQFSRIWVHTHPGSSPTPSNTDETTFARVFGPMDWAVMFIVAEEGQTYARLRFNVGPGGEMPIPVCVDYTRPFAASDHESWQEEYAANLIDEDRLAREAFERRVDLSDAGRGRGLYDASADSPQFADPFYDPFRREGWPEQEELQLLWEEIAYEY
jgi:hypothetical protein